MWCLFAAGLNIYFWLSFIPAIVSLYRYTCYHYIKLKSSWNLQQLPLLIILLMDYFNNFHAKACHAGRNKAPACCLFLSTWNCRTNRAGCWDWSKATWRFVLVWKTSNTTAVDTIHHISGYYISSVLYSYLSFITRLLFQWHWSSLFFVCMQNAFEMATFLWSLVRN